MDHSNWYQRTYPELSQSGVWLRGGELNTLPLAEMREREFRALFVRLSTYFDTGYSFTHQLLYQVAANTPGVYPDLAYLPPARDAQIFARDSIPWLIGTQSKCGPEAFDFIGLSNSIVQEAINVPTFLKKSGIPLKKEERLKRADLPLILLGGANSLYSSCLWMDEVLVDGVFVGESDQALRKILEICRDGKKEGRTKREVLRRLEAVPGFFQPERPSPSRKNMALDLDQSEALENGLVGYLEDMLGSSHLQISEGCPCFCSFCAETWERRPYRERSAEKLKEIALKLKASMGLDSIDIYSFNFNLHSDLYQILWDLIPHFRNIGLKSQRFDLLAHDPQALLFQQVLDKTSLTCGLEGISPRIRRYLHKNLDDAELLSSLHAIFKNRTREIKIFTIATGHEGEQDFLALSDLLDHIQEMKMSTAAKTRVIFSMTPLVRFPWTPLEFEDGCSRAHYAKIIGNASALVKAAGFEFRESADLPEYWVSQILVRAADPKVSRALFRAIESTGFVYYREISEGFMLALERAIAVEGIDPESLLKGFTLEESSAKPWTAIETGVHRQFLWAKCLEARKFHQEDYCLGRSWLKAKCYHCGGCPTRFHVKDIVLSEQKRSYTLDQFKERRRRTQMAERKIDFLLHVNEKALGLPRKAIGVALARALMLTDGGLTPDYRGFAGAFWQNEEKPVWVSGDDRISLYWKDSALKRVNDLLKDEAKLRAINLLLEGWGELRGLAPDAWTPKSVRVTSPWEPKLDDYLKSKGLKYTLLRTADTNYKYDLNKDSLKKGFIKSLRTQSTETATVRSYCSELELGPKFDVNEFLQRAYLRKKNSSPALVRVECISSS